MRITNLARTVWVFFFMLFIAGICQAANPQGTNFYVDANFAGSSRNGGSSNPWQSLNDNGAWNAINSALANGPVTVYFSARQPSSNSNEVTTIPLSISRINTSSNMLTLDGISQYNTNTSSPSWASNVTPAPCWQAGATTLKCDWYTASKFQIGATGTGVTIPMTSTSSASNCQGYVTIQGFKLVRSEGQIANLTYMHDLTVQYVEASAVKGGSYGPGVYVGPANSGPCNGSSGPDNVTVQYNYFHDTYEDCFYDGASTPDPPGYPSSEYQSEKLTCGTACPTGANHLIQYNTMESCADAGGVENVGINIKDGHSNMTVRGNTIRATKAGFSPNAIGPGINLESGGLYDGNYIEAPATVAIAPQIGWNNSVGRSSLTIQNSIIVNVNNGIGRNSGIEVFGPNSGATQLWQSIDLYNNSVYNAGENTGDSCISIDSGNPSGVATVQNNIVETCGGNGLSAASGTLAAHDYNNYYNTTSAPISYGGTASCSGITGSEPHSICANPQFVSTGTPYNATNFSLQSNSPALAAGMTISPPFPDFFDDTRSVPWDLGSIGQNTGGGPPQAPTGVTAVVN